MPPRPRKTTKSKAKWPNLFAFLGSDEAQVKEAALKLAQKLAPADAGEFGLEVIEGGADNADHAAKLVAETIQALQTLPFFGGEKVVWLKSANFLGDSVTGKAESVQNALASLTEVLETGFPEDVKFILSASEIDKRRSFYKKLGALATVEVHDRPDVGREGWEDNVKAVVRQRSRETGLDFDPEALEFFVMLAGVDTRQILNELEKLHLYLGDRRRVEVEDVRKVVPLTHAGVIFEIGNALGRRDLRRALELLDQMLYRGENAIGIMRAAIVPRVRSLLLARDLMDRHKLPSSRYQPFVGALNQLPDSETAHLPRKKDGGINAYPIFLALKEASRFKLPDLRRGLELCLEADIKLVSSQLDPKLVLTRLIVGILN